MKKTLFVFGLLLFMAGGFFVRALPAGAVASTSVPNPAILSDTSGQFVSGEKFWFDGRYYRYSFTAERDFYTGWRHYGDRIVKSPNYAAYLNVYYQFSNGPAGGFGAYFVENISDLDNYKNGDGVYFFWEKGKSYDTYIVDNSISPDGVSTTDMYLDFYLADHPDARLAADKSSVKFEVRFGSNEVNRSRPVVYLDYGYAPPPDKPDPVILIPGILGSWQVNGRWELDPILHTYDNLWEALKTAGYTEGKDLFALPYQWRDSNAITAQKLREKINEIKAICNCSKVDLIGHSMGGLVARSYIEGDNYQNDVDQMIFLATPHRGAPGAYLMWEGGSTGIDQSNWFMDRIFTLEAEFNGYGYVSKYLREKPIKSVEELLPAYDYLRDKDTGLIRTYPNNYPRNIFLEDLNSATSLERMTNIRMLNILGDEGDLSTIDILRVVHKEDAFGDWQNGYPENYFNMFSDHGLEYGPGDNTVPKKSNDNFAGGNNVVIENSNHHQIATDAQRVVIKELTDKEPAQEIRNSYVQNLLMVRIFSPADFQIVAPDGKILGTDFASSSTLNQIAGAYYVNSSNSPEFAIIPNPQAGEYQVRLSGTGNGSYRLSMSYLDDDGAADKDFAGDIVLGQFQDFKISYSASGALSELKPQIDLPHLIADVEFFYRQNLITLDGRNKLLPPLQQLQRDSKLTSIKLDNFEKQLDNLLRQGKTSRLIYDILKADGNYLRNNF